MHVSSLRTKLDIMFMQRNVVTVVLIEAVMACKWFNHVARLMHSSADFLSSKYASFDI